MQHCDRFLAEAPPDTSGRKGQRVVLVDDLRAEVFQELGQLAAQAEYTKAAYGTADPLQPATTGFWHQADVKQGGMYKVHEGTKKLAAGKPEPNVTGALGGFDAAALAEVRAFGLTEAEVLAIKTYTAGDYSYINPAMVSYQQVDSAAPATADKDKSYSQVKDESNAGWWNANLGKVKDATAKDQLRSEGAVHAGVALQAGRERDHVPRHGLPGQARRSRPRQGQHAHVEHVHQHVSEAREGDRVRHWHEWHPPRDQRHPRS